MGNDLEVRELQDLIDATARGNTGARDRLRELAGGEFEGKHTEDTPPMFRGAYGAPNADLPESLEELRAKRTYDRAVVDEFVDKVCDEEWLPPGAAMILFVMLCTKFHSQFSDFQGVVRTKLKAMYAFWDEAHPWVRANILYEMRERLYHKQHQVFCKAFAAKARQYDKVVAAEAEERCQGERARKPTPRS